MNSPSYETFIRICQGCLININGTSPHPSNRSPCSPSPPSMCIFSPRVSSLTLFCLLSVSSLSCLYRPLMISSALTSISKAVPMEREGVESLFPPPQSLLSLMLSISLPPSLLNPPVSLPPPPSSPTHTPLLLSLPFYADDSLRSPFYGPLRSENVWSSSIHLCQTALVP